MDRTDIISFIEKIRPQIKEAGAPEGVLLDAAREHNLAPAQLESTAQMLNTVQQLHFMDKAANRGDSFQLIDVPDLLHKFVQHETPTKAAAEQLDIYATVDAWTKAAAVSFEEGTLPLTGKRLPDVNAKLLKDAGVVTPEVIWDVAPELAREARSSHREQLAKEAHVRNELAGVHQLIEEQQEILRKSAEDVAMRLRTEYDFVWAEAKSDGLVLNKAATEVAAPIIEEYLSQLGTTKQTAHRKVAFDTTPTPQPTRLVTDRHNIVPILTKVAETVDLIVQLGKYHEHVKNAANSSPAVKPHRNTEQERGNTPNSRTADPPKERSGARPSSEAPSSEEQSGDIEMPEEGVSNPLHAIADVIMPPEHLSRSPEEMHSKITDGIDNTFSGIQRVLEKVKGPGQVQEDAMSMIEKMRPGKNKKQMLIDEASTDVRTVTNLQRLMLTDPIIRDADPDMVLSLYNTLQNANPEVTRDPNLLRFALRESIQYESVPLHTYRDLVEMEEKKHKSREMAGRNEDKRYAIS
jgi:hypothetical protein